MARSIDEINAELDTLPENPRTPAERHRSDRLHAELKAARAATSVCGDRNLGPDDIIRPCPLPKGHTGPHEARHASERIKAPKPSGPMFSHPGPSPKFKAGDPVHSTFQQVSGEIQKVEHSVTFGQPTYLIQNEWTGGYHAAAGPIFVVESDLSPGRRPSVSGERGPRAVGVDGGPGWEGNPPPPRRPNPPESPEARYTRLHAAHEQARLDYRAKRIGDAEFLASRKAMEAAMADTERETRSGSPLTDDDIASGHWVAPKKVPPGKVACSICGKVGSKAHLKTHEAKCKSGDCGHKKTVQGSLFDPPRRR